MGDKITAEQAYNAYVSGMVDIEKGDIPMPGWESLTDTRKGWIAVAKLMNEIIKDQ